MAQNWQIIKKRDKNHRQIIKILFKMFGMNWNINQKLNTRMGFTASSSDVWINFIWLEAKFNFLFSKEIKVLKFAGFYVHRMTYKWKVVIINPISRQQQDSNNWPHCVWGEKNCKRDQVPPAWQQWRQCYFIDLLGSNGEQHWFGNHFIFEDFTFLFKILQFFSFREETPV